MIKILATLGPNSLSENIIREMDKEKVDLYRINMSHTSIDKLEGVINSIQKVSNTSICIDSEGAQLRNQYMEQEKVLFKSGEKVTVHFSDIVGDKNNISLNNVNGARQLSVGDEIRIDFNGVMIKVVETSSNQCLTKVINGGNVGSNKAVSINKIINLPTITEKDKLAIQIGKEMGVRNFALSFSGSQNDVKSFRNLTGPEALIISKSRSDVQNSVLIPKLVHMVLSASSETITKHLPEEISEHAVNYTAGKKHCQEFNICFIKL